MKTYDYQPASAFTVAEWHSSASRQICNSLLTNIGVPEKFGRRMNPSFCLIHWPGRGRYDFRRSAAFVLAATGQWLWRFSATSFHHRFVNQISECDLVELIYHLFSGLPGCGSFACRAVLRLKTEASRRIVQLQAADSEISQISVVGLSSLVVRQNLRKNRELVRFPANRLGVVGFGTSNDERPTSSFSARFPALLDLYQANQMSLCAEAFYDF